MKYWYGVTKRTPHYCTDHMEWQCSGINFLKLSGNYLSHASWHEIQIQSSDHAYLEKYVESINCLVHSFLIKMYFEDTMLQYMQYACSLHYLAGTKSLVIAIQVLRWRQPPPGPLAQLNDGRVIKIFLYLRDLWYDFPFSYLYYWPGGPLWPISSWISLCIWFGLILYYQA